jgi:hypothetical protein
LPAGGIRWRRDTLRLGGRLGAGVCRACLRRSISASGGKLLPQRIELTGQRLDHALLRLDGPRQALDGW